jgi:hypothetical protein
MRAFGKRSLSSFLVGLLMTARGIVAIILGIAVLLLVGSPFGTVREGGRLSIPAAVVVDTPALHVSAPSLDIANAQISPLRGEIRFPASRRTWVVAPAIGAVMLGVLFWVLTQLLRLFETLRAGQPFAPDNARRVRRLAWVVIMAEPLRAVVTYGSEAYVASHFVADGFRFTKDFNLNVGTIIGGLIILVIAEVFRVGTGLDEDQSLTI